MLKQKLLLQQQQEKSEFKPRGSYYNMHTTIISTSSTQPTDHQHAEFLCHKTTYNFYYQELLCSLSIYFLHRF